MMTKMDETCFWLSQPLQESDSPSEQFITSHLYSGPPIYTEPPEECQQPLTEQGTTTQPTLSILGLDELAQLDGELAVAQHSSMMDGFLALVDSAAAMDIPIKAANPASIETNENSPLTEMQILDNTPDLADDLSLDQDISELLPLENLDIERVIDGIVSETLPQIEHRLRIRLRLLIQSSL